MGRRLACRAHPAHRRRPAAIPTQAAQAKASRRSTTRWRTPFDLRHRRDTAASALTYAATTAIDVDARFTSSRREGQQPLGASFAFNNAVEVPLPIDQRTNDITLGASWANPKHVPRRLGRVVVQQRQREPRLGQPDPAHRLQQRSCAAAAALTTRAATATATVRPGADGACAGNRMNVVSATGLYKMRARTTVNGTLQFTSQTQNEA